PVRATVTSMDIYHEPNSNASGSGGPSVPPTAAGWRRCCERLRAELGEDVFNSWFGRLELESLAGGQARLSVPTRFLKSWIDTHYVGHITTALTGELGPIARIVVSVRSSTRPETSAIVCTPGASPAAPVGSLNEEQRSAPAARRPAS